MNELESISKEAVTV